MKKLFFILACLIVAASLFAGGRSSGSASASRGPSAEKRYSSLPLSDGRTTFTVFVGGIGDYGVITSFDYRDNTYTRKIVDDTGVKLEFIAVSTSDKNERMSILLNSGDYPDLIINTLTLNDLLYYAQQKIFIPLDDYHVLEYPNIARTFNDYPALNMRLRGTDGKLYALPSVNDCIHCVYQIGRTWYYMPWIRDNNRAAPTTLDELTTYLRWIRDNDVNGNGNRNDEIPLAFSATDLENVVAFIAKAYMPWVNVGLALYDGVVTEQYRLNEFREVLRYLNGLYKEGLIKEDSFTMNGDQFKALLSNPTPIVGVYGGAWADYTGPWAGNQRAIESFVMPMLRGPTGQRWGANNDPWSILGTGLIVTDKCKDPELAVALYNYMIDYTVMLEDLGQKGEGWDVADSGALNLVGGPALYKYISGWNQPVNHTSVQQFPFVRDLTFRQGQQATNPRSILDWMATGDPGLLPRLLTDNEYQEIFYNNFSLDQKDITIPEKYFIPPIAMNETDTNRISDINAVLTSYKKQAWAEFIVGVRNIDSNTDWNNYLADLDRIGTRDLVAITQKYVK
jgi:putative aldouronate transport system substrate-binding protein